MVRFDVSHFAFLVTLLGLAATGCEKQSASFDGVVAEMPAETHVAQALGRSNSPALPEGQFADGDKVATMRGDAGPEELKPAPARKVIFTADLALIVKDFTAAEAALHALLSKHEGQIAQSDLGATTGQQRQGRWKLRVPVARYEAFLKEAAALGEPERNKLDSQDVTEEFYDVTARLRNKKTEEERLLQHMKETAGKLTEILEVEKELSRVRGEIERMQGRLNLMANLTTLTTINLTLREIKDYVPPSAPTFGTKLSRSFLGSWESLTRFGENLALYAAASVVWLPFLAVLGGVGYWLLRRKRQVV